MCSRTRKILAAAAVENWDPSSEIKKTSTNNSSRPLQCSPDSIQSSPLQSPNVSSTEKKITYATRYGISTRSKKRIFQNNDVAESNIQPSFIPATSCDENVNCLASSELSPYVSSSSDYIPSDSETESDNAESERDFKSSDVLNTMKRTKNKLQKRFRFVGESSNMISKLKNTIGRNQEKRKHLPLSPAEDHTSTLDAVHRNNSNLNEPNPDENCLTSHNFQNQLEPETTSTIDISEADAESSTVSLTAVVNNGFKRKRRRDKRHCCYICSKILTNNMARHFEVVHREDIDVARILAMPKHSKARREGFEILIRSGDFYHNLNVLTMDEGELILARRTDPNREYSYADFSPCNYCLGFMQTKYLSVHLKKCKAKKTQLNSTQSTSRRGPLSESSAFLFNVLGPKVNDQFRLDIVNTFKLDSISKVCKEDELILTVGGFLYEKYGVLQADLIRQSMRQLGRLKIELNSNNSKSLSQWITPGNFNQIVLATKAICGQGFEKDKLKQNEFKIPSLALKIGHLLRKCVAVESGSALRSGSIQRHTELKQFTELMDLEWCVRISSKALNTMYRKKMNAAQLLPLTSDLLKLNTFLESQMKLLRVVVAQNCTKQVWARLASVVLCKIILFNKRRSGESSRMTLSNYFSKPSWTEQGTDEFKNSLTPLERQLANRLTVVEIVGKRNRKVPVIMSEEIKDCVELLIKKRAEGEISTENPYVFARSQISKLNSHLRGPDCLRNACSDAKLTCSENVTSTKLRKYIATVCQIFDLKENERDWLARHLGHDIRIHREFYSLHDSAIELTKVSRLLLAVDNGVAQEFAGKQLKDIAIEQLPDLELEDEVESGRNDHEELQTSNMDLFEQPEASAVVTKDKETVATSLKRDLSRRKGWSSAEANCVLDHFKLLVNKNTLPGKKACEEFIEKHSDVLKNRKWTDIKFYVKNHISKATKLKTK